MDMEHGVHDHGPQRVARPHPRQLRPGPGPRPRLAQQLLQAFPEIRHKEL